MNTIYWSYCNSSLQIRAEEPVPMFQNYFKSKDALENGLDYIRCPAFKELFKNTFCLKSLFDYNLTFDKDVTSSKHDQEFFEKMVTVRNHKSRLASLSNYYFFMTEDDSLEMEYLPSVMENNSFNATSIFIPAVLDVGKYARTLDCAFHCRENKMEIKEDDVYAYVKFKTDKTIKFQRFLWTDEMESTMDNTILGLTSYRRKTFKPLAWYYKKQEALETKKRVMKLIKKNLIGGKNEHVTK